MEPQPGRWTAISGTEIRDAAGLRLQSALQELHLQAGKPSARLISRRLGDVSHTTVADLLTGRRVVSWEITRRVVLDLGGTETEFLALWKQAAGTAQAAVAPVSPAQLPPSTAAFSGRQQELGALTALLAPAAEDHAAAVSLIVGLAGVGKTELAIQAAHAAVAASWFPGGVVFLDLHGYDQAPVQPDQALDSLLRTLGIPSQYIPPTAEEKAGLYRSVLARTADPMLLIMDNASTEAQVRPLLPGRGPHRVLVTSRNTMAVLSARIFDLTSLSQDDSVELLDKTLRLARPKDARIRNDRDAARRLADVCGELPLALRISAALLTDDPAMTVEGLTAELGSDVDRMNDLRYDDVSVQAAFDFSYRQLDEGTARVFGFLSVHPSPGLSAEAVAALTNEPGSEIRRTIGKLLQSHLVERTSVPGHWRLHDLLRAYSSSLPEPDDAERDQARDRLLTFYYSVASYLDFFLTRQRPPRAAGLPAPPVSHHFEDYSSAIKWAQHEITDILACVNYLARNPRAEAMAWIVLFAETLAGFLRNETLWTDAIELQTRAIKAAGELEIPLAKANALIERANVHRLRGELIPAQADLEEAIAIYREIGGEAGLTGEAHALNIEGVVLDQQARRPEADRRFASALGIYVRLNDRLGEANVLQDQGMAELFAKEHGSAADLLARALEIYQEVGHPLGIAHAHNYLARAQGEMGRIREAIENLESAQALYRGLGGGYHSEVTTLIQQSALEQERDRETAIQLLDRAIQRSREIGARAAEVDALDARAKLYMKDGNEPAAAGMWQDALEIAGRLDLKREARIIEKEVAGLGRG